MAKKKPLNVYSVDMKLAATIYVKAYSSGAARALAQTWADNTFSFPVDGEMIADVSFKSAELPQISLSPVMTGKGLFGGKRAAMELCEEDVPDPESEDKEAEAAA